jgi:hypothetical protein
MPAHGVPSLFFVQGCISACGDAHYFKDKSMEEVELGDQTYGFTSLGVLVELSLNPASRNITLAGLTKTQEDLPTLLASS